MAENPGLRRALLLMTSTSLLVPLIGIFTAPILAQALGVAGRGEVAAALAPNALLVSVATLGLPEALTFHLAKRPDKTRIALAWSALFSFVLGVVCFVAAASVADFLAGGDSGLRDLIVLGTALALPMLGVNILRGAASGRQMWKAVALERALNSFSRLVVLAVLAVLGQLDVLTALLVMALGPVVAGVAYWRLLLRPPVVDSSPMRVAPEILGFGSKIWLGSVASMLTGRLGQLLVTPLSDVRELGLLVVAITISDVPFIVATAVRDVLFGVNSADPDAPRLAATSRIATWVGFAGSLAMGLSLPLWIGVIFGEGFEASTVPTWLLLGAAVANVPGLIAGAGLGAWNRPGLRSAALGVALGSNLLAFLLLVPTFGAVGAGAAGLISGVATSLFTVAAASRVMQQPFLSFLTLRREDVLVLRAELVRLLSRFKRTN